jgi:hypothetical protein
MTTNGRNEENLKELFERFVSTELAEEAVEHIRKGEQIFRERPAPEPNSELISDIKAEIAGALLRRKGSAFKRIAYKAAVAVAVVIFVAVVSVKLLERGGGEPKRVATASIIPAAIWESDGADLAILTAEIKQIEGRVQTLQLGENEANGDKELVELEMRLIALDSDFWKE